MEVNVLHPSEFVDDPAALSSPTDHGLLQAMFDRAMEITNQRVGGGPTPVVVDWRGINAKIDDTLLITIHNDTWAPIHIDMRGGMISGRQTGFNAVTGKSNVQPVLKVLNTRSGAQRGNIRDLVIEGGITRYGAAGLWLDGVQYCEVRDHQAVHSVMVGMFLKTNGNSNSNILNNLKVLEAAGLSMLVQGDWTIDGLRIGEGGGSIGVRSGRLTVNNFNGVGFNLYNPVKAMPHWGWTQDTSAADASVWKEFGWNAPPAGIDPIFHLTSHASLVMDGKVQVYGGEPAPRSATSLPPNTIVHAQHGGLIDMDMVCRLSPDIKQIVAEGHIPGANTPDGKEQWPLNVRIRDARLHGDIALYRRNLAFDPSAVVYPSIRLRRNFTGHMRFVKAGQILQDTHAPVDLSNLDIVNA
jgi:hypothetical protein